MNPADIKLYRIESEIENAFGKMLTNAGIQDVFTPESNEEQPERHVSLSVILGAGLEDHFHNDTTNGVSEYDTFTATLNVQASLPKDDAEHPYETIALLRFLIREANHVAINALLPRHIVQAIIPQGTGRDVDEKTLHWQFDKSYELRVAIRDDAWA